MESNDAQALREALEAAIYCLQNRRTCSGYTVEATIEKIRAALAAPARNCDVGTAEEQEARFDKVCMNYSGGDVLCDQKCPMFARHAQGHSCMFEWTQLPCTEGEAAMKREADSIERIVRDAIIDYNGMYPSAPNDDAERELRERAAIANAWLKQHGFEEEPCHWSKEETSCL